ncbi:SAM-dependent methyltransferase [Actinomadura parmotrematis]|uniref:SAM-dependent methyltransferase n=1 Tax=Actinomadura parmotrematis TaxID=2864039 RepID=A0ABS7FTP5_9ACTN|nr:SAM-dependent methyltransferase [Actinomadura parmotrematis]MBW8483779.1 SAM-dependent methyltransferase [Actinomadura parmotrematis]
MASDDSGPLPSQGAAPPNIARAYNHLLGGKDTLEADRLLAERMLEAWPRAADAAIANRRFIRRSVRFMVEQGVDQFVDVGAGLPTENNVHQVAQALNPDARVVYVDNDPVVVSHGNALLAGTGTRMLQADMSEPAAILDDPAVRELIDFGRPVGVLFVASLHFLSPEEDAHGVVAAFRDAMAPGGHLAISHGLISEEIREAVQRYKTATDRGTPRTEAEIAAFFDGFTLVEPGLVPLGEWQREPAEVPENMAGLPMLAGVGRR